MCSSMAQCFLPRLPRLVTDLTAMEFRKNEGENERQFLWRIGEAKTSGLLDASWDEIAEVINREFRDEDDHRNEGMYRRPYTAAKAFYEDVFSKMGLGADKNITASLLENLKAERLELLKERQRLRDERAQLGKYVRDEARLDQRLDELESKWVAAGKERYREIEPNAIWEMNASKPNQREILVLLSDWHIGLEFDGEFGRYNTTIAKERLRYLAVYVRAIAKQNHIKTCNVAMVGDMISGAIRPSIMVANRENIIEQVMTAAEMAADFLYEMCCGFEEVNFVSVAGNHSRVEANKEKAIKDDRLDDLIGWYVKSTFRHIHNFKPRLVVDNTVAELGICGQLYYFAHGDHDELTQAGISKLAFMMGDIPYAVCMGHRHVPALTEVSGVKVVQNGALCGAGDNHTVEKRLSGKASQTVMICNEQGIEAYFPVVMT